LRLGPLTLPSRFWLAPLAGYTNLAFRTVVRDRGGLGLATSDLVSAKALLIRSRKTLDLIQTAPDDRPLSIQIYGADPTDMRAAAQWLEAYGVSSIDINMGCPVHKVTRGGGGSALMCDRDKTLGLIRAVVEAVRVPITVKMRLGWDDASLSAPFFAREFEQAGVAAVTIHGRTREQGFGGRVNLDGIKAVVEATERIPVIGNGDVRTIADAARMLEATGCAGLAIGRGALANPWIFAQLASWQTTGTLGPVPSYAERLALMDRHFHLLTEFRSERFGCLTFRKVATWYCKALRTGREMQQRLVQVNSVAEFEAIVAELRARQAPIDDFDWVNNGPAIPVPKGPISHW
jgi:nifR3 family TIM-barrel protein